MIKVSVAIKIIISQSTVFVSMCSVSFLISLTNFFYRYAQIKHERLSLENLLTLCWTKLYSNYFKKKKKKTRKERITATEKQSEGKLDYYLKNSIPMFNMNLELQEVGLEECATEII